MELRTSNRGMLRSFGRVEGWGLAWASSGNSSSRREDVFSGLLFPMALWVGLFVPFGALELACLGPF
jgi:hypothetical protein